MQKQFSVCYASSNDYAPYTGISLLSVLKNNSDIIDNVFVLSFGILDENKSKIKEIVEAYHCHLSIVDAIPILVPIFERIHLETFRGSYATFSRAFISYLIPNTVDYLLYIDSDTIVDGSLEEILHLKMNDPDKVFAAVIGTNQYYDKDNPELVLDNGNTVYYQAGVIYFNLTNWRKYRCSERIEDYVLMHNSSYLYADQTVINNVIEEKYIAPLHPKYNYWGHIYRGPRLWYQMRLGGFWSDDVIREAKDTPVIIHYKGHVVHPWKTCSISSLRERYQYYKTLSPWMGEPEHSIFYDYKQLRDTVELKRKYKREIWGLRLLPCVIRLIMVAHNHKMRLWRKLV